MEREDQRAEELDLRWDAIQNGYPVPQTGRENDADLTELIARLQEAISTPPLFANPWQAWEEFEVSTALADASPASRAPSAPFMFAPNGRVSAPVDPGTGSPVFRPFHSPTLAYMATAALLVLALTAGLVAFWQGSQTDDELIAIPAMIATPDGTPGTTEASGVTEEPIYTATFPAGELPTGEAGAVLYRLTIEPGATLSNLGGLSCGCTPFDLGHGVGVELIESGDYTVRLDSPIRVQRGGVTGDEKVSAGTEITLSPGDVAFYSQYDAPGEIRNSGTSPVKILGVAIVGSDGAVDPPPLPKGVQGSIVSQTMGSIREDLPAGPVTVTLRQVTLPADATLGPYQTAGLEAFQLLRGRVARSFLSAGEAEPRGRSVFNATGTASSALAAVSPGTRRVITNVGDEPAVLLILTVEPARNELP